METRTFAELTAGIAKLLRIAQPAPNAASMQLLVDDLPVTLMDGAAVQPESLVFACDFGPVPQGAARSAILQELLQANLYTVSAGAPTFCVDPNTGHALFVGKLAIAQTSVTGLLEAFTEFAKEADAWRRNCRNAEANPAARSLSERHSSLIRIAANHSQERG